MDTGFVPDKLVQKWENPTDGDDTYLVKNTITPLPHTSYQTIFQCFPSLSLTLLSTYLCWPWDINQAQTPLCIDRWLTSQRATRFLGMSGANGESMGCLGACCQLWEEWRSGGLPGRGDTCLQQSWKKWACWDNKVREPRFRQREGVESAEVQSQAGFVWWNWLLSWWAYKNFLCVRVLISMHSVYFLLYHLTLILFIMLFV